MQHRVRQHTNRNISIPIELDNWLRQRARIEDRPVSRIVKQSLLQYKAAVEKRTQAAT